MKQRITPLVGSFLCATALTLSAQTFTEDNSGTPAVNTYTRVNDYVVDEIVFNNGTGKATNPWAVNPVSLKQTEVTIDGATVTVYDICAELFVGEVGISTYSVAGGFGALNSSQQLAVRKLFTNTLSNFIALQSVDYDQASEVGAAIQLAFWEIVEDNASGLSGASLDEDFATPGNVSISGFNLISPAPGSYDGKTKAAIDLAEGYLENLRNDTWTDNGGLNFYYADGGTNQDRLWVTAGASVIPEPSTALLSILGLGFLLRRKRN